jgi:hypothetical protein
MTLANVAASTGSLSNSGTMTITTFSGLLGTLTNTGTLNLTGTTTNAINVTTLTAGTAGLINFNGAAQTVNHAGPYFNLTFSGTGIKTITVNATIAGDFIITSGLPAVVLTTGTSSPIAGGLQLGGSWKSATTWGSSISAATNKSDTYFAVGASGIVTVAKSHHSEVSAPVVQSPVVSGGSHTTTTSAPVTNPVTAPTTPSVVCYPGETYSTTTGARCNIFASAPAAPAVVYAFGTGLVKFGSKGVAAEAWQKFFNDKTGFHLVADGIFGKLSIGAAKAWQKSVGLKADGVLGPLSRAKALVQQ